MICDNALFELKRRFSIIIIITHSGSLSGNTLNTLKINNEKEDDMTSCMHEGKMRPKSPKLYQIPEVEMNLTFKMGEMEMEEEE